MKKPLCTRTLRWAARRIKSDARKLKALDDFEYGSAYGDAGHDLLIEARAIEAKQKKQGRKR